MKIYKQIVRICCGYNGVYNAMPLCGAVTKLTEPGPAANRCTLREPAATPAELSGVDGCRVGGPEQTRLGRR